MQSQKENLAPIGDADSSVLAGRHFGAWVVARIDPTGRRAIVVCKCGETRQVSVDALLSGESMGCGCRLTRHRPGYPQADRDAFAGREPRVPVRPRLRGHSARARQRPETLRGQSWALRR